MLIPVLLFIVGLLFLIKGGDWFVDGASALARRFHLPELLIGATVVSIGTTLPEVMVSTMSALSGHGEIAYGNAIGSVICNAALIAAITIAVRPGKVDPKTLKTPVAFFFAAAAIYCVAAYGFGKFTRPMGLIMLALFVGSLLTATMIHVNAPMPELSRLRPWQRFFGRYQLFFLVGMVQALVTGLGCVYYIGMQCLHPGLFLLACCVCSLNFTMMNYALVYALDNIGMALSVIIMVIQVAGSGGVYPIDVLPGIFQTLYKFMPFHYGMDMLRETIAGRYENVYWKNLAVMAGMCVLFAVLGMLLYYPARPLNRLIARSKEKSGLM